VWRATRNAKNAINAENPSPSGVTAFSALGDQQPEVPPMNPAADPCDAISQPSHVKKPLVEEFA
jgi:hypothetical protein